MEGQAPNPLLSPPELSPLEQEVLEEYERLAENMKKVSLNHLSHCIASCAHVSLYPLQDMPHATMMTAVPTMPNLAKADQ